MTDRIENRGGADYNVNVTGGTVDPFAPTTVKTGEIVVGTANGVFPTVACRQVIFKASKANAGTAYIGFGTAVTAENGTADATTGLQMIAGDATPVISISNLNKFYGIASADGQIVTYLATL